MSNIIDSIQLSGVTYQIQGGGGGGVPESTFTAYTATTDERISQDEEVTAAGLNALNSKITPTVELTQAEYEALTTKDPNTYYIITDAQAGDLTNYYTKTETNTLLGGKQATLVSGTNIKTINNESILGSGNIDIQGGGVDVVQTTGTSTTDVMSQNAVTTALNNKQDSSKLPTYIVGDVTFGAGQVAVIRTLKSNGGSTRNTNNVITINNQAIFNNSNLTNLSLVETSAITTTVSSSSTDAQVPSAKAVYDAIQEGGGGSTYTAGRGISIANDTISFSLPISAGTGTNSVIEGSNTTASGNYSHAEGYNTTASGSFSHAEGVNVTAKNVAEHASGRYNNSVSASTTFGDSGNTLFSVGNGIADNVRHNAFEIRQNGDIYLTLDGQDVKLQDQLGGSSITVDSALSSTSENPVQNKVIYNKIDEVEQVTAAGLNSLNDNFGGLKLVKLTQAEYNALATKDSSTLYVIVD